MSVDYAALSKENRLEYGRAIGRIGKMLLEDRYDKRTHFIYEVLQNAEDALRRRQGWAGSRTVTFTLTKTELRISHYGAPFTDADVRGVCGIDASTKDVTSIGRFGIGFKSVYAFTGQPEIHSGAESFSISDYVLPKSVPPADRDEDQTLIILPLREDDPGAFGEIAQGLRSLGAEALLFLKYIEEVRWAVEGEDSGSYRREGSNEGFMREIELHTVGIDEARQQYLLFSRDVENLGSVVGEVELAFRTELQNGERTVQPIPDARLAVFFPTVLPTHTGFLLQGPYQTTPSRDNIPADKPWNITLAKRTGELVVEVFEHLQAQGLLTVSTLRTLPLDRSKLSGGLFQPVYDDMVSALSVKRLLPTSTGSFANAAELRIARAQDVRDLFGSKQLSALLGADGRVAWASAEITSDRAPQLRSFLMQELKVPELTLEQMLGRIDDKFLSDQSDAWMVRFYRLLASQPVLMRTRAKDMALYRLDSGEHVPLMKHGVRQVFLPTDQKTGFPTLRLELVTPLTRKFFESAGLTTPDPVDDVIHHLLPNYQSDTVDTSNYAEDVGRMVRAFETDSQAQRDKLIGALRTANIVMVRDAGTGESYIHKPGDVYLAAARMTKLFDGVKDVFLVDATYECLRGEKVREMLEACGATRILRTQSVRCDLSEGDRQSARRAAGWEGFSTEYVIQDVDIAGLEGVLELLPQLPDEERGARARLLWEGVTELVDRRGPSVVSVPYSWTYHQTRSTYIDAKFLRRLKESAWVPDELGGLRPPSEVLFESLGWSSHVLLETRIGFKPPAIAALAREVGIDPDVLDELKRLGVTDLGQLRERLKDGSLPDQDRGEDTGSGTEASGGSGPGEGEDDRGGDAGPNDTGTGGRPASSGGERQSGQAGGGGGGGTSGDTRSNRNSSSSAAAGKREFISYIGVRPDGETRDPDGLAHQERMNLEEAAIAYIQQLEPFLKRTPVGNKGFDLLEEDVAGEPERWIEVKAMKGTLDDRPVGLSSAQMEQARRCGDQYWLYVVELAGTPQARLLKIRNPHGAAGTFTFDVGWKSIAEDIPPSVQSAAE